LPVAFAQVVVIVAGGAFGWRLLATPTPGVPPATVPPATVPPAATIQPASVASANPELAAPPGAPPPVRVGQRLAIAAWLAFFGLLVLLPLARSLTGSESIALIDSFYRSGALVFGGGHVVLPLLQAELVSPGWVSAEQFLAGYGAAQAVPGPLFTFSAYLGAVTWIGPGGWLGAVLALASMFLPAFLLTFGSLAYWQRLRGRADAQAVLRGVNAAVVGLLLAALYDPVWVSAIRRPTDFCLTLVALALLALWRTPPWLVVLLTVLGGVLLG
jgi:chromate transporter